MDADERYCGTCKHGTLYDLCAVCENEWESKMDADERYLDRLEGRRIAESSYASLADCADDEAYDALVSYIQDDMDDSNTREYLLSIAVIWQSRGTTQEKYGCIGDLFQGVVDRIASKNSTFD